MLPVDPTAYPIPILVKSLSSNVFRWPSEVMKLFICRPTTLFKSLLPPVMFSPPAKLSISLPISSVIKKLPSGSRTSSTSTPLTHAYMSAIVLCSNLTVAKCFAQNCANAMHVSSWTSGETPTLARSSLTASTICSSHARSISSVTAGVSSLSLPPMTS